MKRSFNWAWFFKAVTTIVISLIVLLVAAIVPVIDQPLYNWILFHPAKYPVGYYEQNVVEGITGKDVLFHSANGNTLHGWLFVNPNARYICLLSHGNGENMTFRRDVIAMILKQGQSVFAYDYQGYGKSTGSPSMYNICEDAFAAYQYLIALSYQPTQIILFGESLGTSVTGQLAKNVRCAAIVLQAPVSSLARRSGEIMEGLRLIPNFLWPQFGFDNIQLVRGSHPPILVVAGTKDPMIPITHADSLYDAASQPITYIRVEGGGHTYDKVLMGQQYVDAFDRFIRALP